jgi:hypothetical protein
MRQQDILPAFQEFLRTRRSVPEKNIPFYAWWASRFLAFGNKNEHLPLDIRIEQFLKEIQINKPLADWQLRQAGNAVRLYTGSFAADNDAIVLPALSNVEPEKAHIRFRSGMTGARALMADGGPLEHVSKYYSLRYNTVRSP